MQQIGQPVQPSFVNSREKKMGRRNKRLMVKLKKAIFSFETVSLVIGLLLGRAVILSGLAPFGIPFFATVALLKPKRKVIALASLLVGAATVSLWHTLYMFMAVTVFSLLRAIAMKLSKKEEAKMLPYIVLISGCLSRLGYYSATGGSMEPTKVILAIVEGGLAFLLTLIFLQSLPLISSGVRKRSLKNEEIVCLIILLASILTGTIGWSMHDISIEHVLSRYFVILFAFIGGAAIGSTVGVVIGLILGLAHIDSLYQMSLLAFSGLLGGLLKEGKKIGVSLGLIVGTLLISLYGQGYSQLINTTSESLLAILLFFMTPKWVYTKIASFIPGTPEYHRQEQQYVIKLRDVTAKRVEQFSSLFQTLSSSFSRQLTTTDDENVTREKDLFLSKVTEKTCQRCSLKESCWVRNFDKTYSLISEIMNETTVKNTIHSPTLNRQWRNHCVKPDKVVKVIRELQDSYLEELKLKKKMRESRRLVADQLLGVSRVMGDFAKEIQREKENHQQQEEQILFKLQEIGLDVENVDIYNLTEGSVDIDMTIPADYHSECEKIIAPILSDILGETIVVQKHIEPAVPNGYGQVTFGSAKAYVVKTGVAYTAQGGGWISGDNYDTFELGGGKYAIAISDGMGNGERAYHESKETLKLLSKVLKSGIDETIAIKSINSILSLRTTDEIFSTLDLAMIDLQNASARFLKIGSNPSYIKRGEQIIKVEASNLPMGIIQEFDVEVVGEQLKANDILVMMSDGIFDAPKNVNNPDAWLKRKILEMQTDDPQEIADLLLEEVIRTAGGTIKDDMTVVVSKISHHTPKWASIPTYTKADRVIRKAQ
ncbi:MAG: stage II sporulation protein E [Tuberibacillus sp.]